MTSCQESRNPSTLGNCCFGSGEEFSSTTSKLKLAKQCGRQASKITRSTSLGAATAGNLKLDFMAKSIGIHFFGFEDVIEIKQPFARMDTLRYIKLIEKIFYYVMYQKSGNKHDHKSTPRDFSQLRQLHMFMAVSESVGR